MKGLIASSFSKPDLVGRERGGGGLHSLKAKQGAEWGKMQGYFAVTLQPRVPSLVLRGHGSPFSPPPPPTLFWGARVTPPPPTNELFTWEIGSVTGAPFGGGGWKKGLE